MEDSSAAQSDTTTDSYVKVESVKTPAALSESTTLIVEGLEGNLTCVNGNYISQGNLGERVHFQQEGGKFYLRWEKGYWTFTQNLNSTQQDEEVRMPGSVFAYDDSKLPNEVKTQWQSLSDGKPVNQQLSIKVFGALSPQPSPETQLLEDHWEEREDKSDSDHVTHGRILVEGCEGKTVMVNGIYLRGEGLQCDRPFWVKEYEDSTIFLRWDVSGHWVLNVSNDDVSDDDESYDVCKGAFARNEDDVNCPTFCKHDWRIKELFFGQYVPYPKLKLTGLGPVLRRQSADLNELVKCAIEDELQDETNTESCPVMVRKKSVTFNENAEDEDSPQILKIANKVTMVGHATLEGDYFEMQKKVNDRPCFFFKKEDCPLYLRYHTCGAWVISDKLEESLEAVSPENLDQKPNQKGYAVVLDDADHPSEIKCVWTLFESFLGNYVSFPKLHVKKVHKVQALLSAGEVEDLDDKPNYVTIFEEAPEPLMVTGFTANNAFLNGTYWKGDRMHEERVYYESNSENHEIFLRFHESGHWIFASTMGFDMVPLAAAQDEAYTVLDIRAPWQAPSGIFGNFCTQDVSIGLKSSNKRFPRRTLVEEGTKRTPVESTVVEEEVVEEDVIAEVEHINPTILMVKGGGCFDGIYQISDVLQNDRPLYRKLLGGFITDDCDEMVITYHKRGYWLVTTDMTRFNGCYARANSKALSPDQVATGDWKIRRRNQFVREPRFLVMGGKAEDESESESDASVGCIAEDLYDTRMNKAEVSIMLSGAPEKLVVSGRKGKNECINGLYYKGRKAWCGKAYWVKKDNSIFLRWHPEGVWIFSPNLDKCLNGFAMCKDEAYFPCEAKNDWKVFEKRSFRTDLKVEVLDWIKRQKDFEKFVAEKNKQRQKEMTKHFEHHDCVADFPCLKKHNNVLSKVLTEDMFSQLQQRRTRNGYTFAQTIAQGVRDAESRGSGVIAGDAESYVAFAPLYNALLKKKYTGYGESYLHKTKTETSGVAHSGFDPKYALSARICVDRNLQGYRMPNQMTTKHSEEVLNLLTEACDCLKEYDTSLAGRRKDITEELRQIYDMQEPSSNFTSKHPRKGGVYVSRQNHEFSLWMNERNHCSMVATEVDGDVVGLFNQVYGVLESVNLSLMKTEKSFSTSPHFGHLTADPVNCGTALEISVTCNLPHLSHDPNLASILCRLRLTCKSATDSTIVVANRDRVGVTEVEILEYVISGVELLIKMEQHIHEGGKLEALKPRRKSSPWLETDSIARLRKRISVIARMNSLKNVFGPAPNTLMVTGRVGDNDIINGLYMKHHDKFLGKPYWEKLDSMRSVFLRFHDSGMWVVDDELVNEYKGFAFCKSEVPYPSLCEEAWYVLTNGKFVIDSHVSCMDHAKGIRLEPPTDEKIHWESAHFAEVPHVSQPVSDGLPLLRNLSIVNMDLEDKEIERFDDYPEHIIFKGSNEREQFINGKYAKGDFEHEERPFWKKCDDSYTCVVRWHPKGLWVVSDWLTKSLRGFALVQDPKARDPSQVTRNWKVCTGTKKAYIKNPNVKVLTMSDADDEEQKASSLFE